MKILLNVLPRTGSKWLNLNLFNYLEQTIRIPPMHEIYGIKNTISDWFNYKKQTELFINGEIIMNGDNFKVLHNPINNDEECVKRLGLLKDCKLPLTIKEHPHNWYSLIAIEELKNNVDRYYTLRRKDTFEQGLSMSVCSYTNLWQPGLEQLITIKKSIKSPFELDEKVFLQHLEMITLSNNYLDNQNPTKHLYFEDLILMDNPDLFCEYLGLPKVDFRMNYNSRLEYGTAKKEMITNYDRLRELYQDYKRNGGR